MDSPLGAGRPGWHVECSAMSAKFLAKVLIYTLGAKLNLSTP